VAIEWMRLGNCKAVTKTFKLRDGNGQMNALIVKPSPNTSGQAVPFLSAHGTNLHKFSFPR
jgi:hypothetical protein